MGSPHPPHRIVINNTFIDRRAEFFLSPPPPFPLPIFCRSSQSKLFGKFNLGNLIENASVSVVAKDAADEVVGFLAMYVRENKNTRTPH